MAGIDQGGRATLGLQLVLRLKRRRRLPTPAETERMLAEFDAGGPMQEKVVGRVIKAAQDRDEGRRRAGMYLAHKN